MRRRIVLGAVSALALAAGSLYLLRRDGGDDVPPRMNTLGEATDTGLVLERKTIDYETVVRSALSDKASLIVATLKADVIRDQSLKQSIRYTPLPASTARVRVKYHVEYPIGFPLEDGDFSVTRKDGSLVVRVRRPRLVARPSVRLLSYDVLESGILVDEKTAIIELQRRIQPEAERRAGSLVARRGIAVRGERVLRRLIENVIRQASPPGTEPPRVVIEYR